MKSLLGLVVILMGGLVGCATESEESADEQDVTSTLEAKFKEQVVESSTNTCNNKSVYYQIVDGVPAAAQKRINEALKSELPPCGNPAEMEDTLVEQNIGMNRMGILSVEQVWSRYVGTGASSPTIKRSFFLFELKTGDTLTIQDVFNESGEAVLIDECDRRSFGSRVCGNVGETLALSPSSFLTHMDLVGAGLDRSIQSSFTLFKPNMFKHALIKKLVTTVNSEQ